MLPRERGLAITQQLPIGIHTLIRNLFHLNNFGIKSQLSMVKPDIPKEYMLVKQTMLKFPLLGSTHLV